MSGGTGGSWDEARVDGAPPAAALLRRPSVWIRHQVMTGLHDAGFTDILPAHLGVFQYPGPDGQRPGVLAVRTHASKQAMNHLLHQLQSAGYIVREANPEDGRTRVVRLTERGWAAVETITETIQEIEKEWADLLGEDTYLQLRQALGRLEAVLDGDLGGP